MKSNKKFTNKETMEIVNNLFKPSEYSTMLEYYEAEKGNDRDGFLKGKLYEAIFPSVIPYFIKLSTKFSINYFRDFCTPNELDQMSKTVLFNALYYFVDHPADEKEPIKRILGHFGKVYDKEVRLIMDSDPYVAYYLAANIVSSSSVIISFSYGEVIDLLKDMERISLNNMFINEKDSDKI